VLDLHAERGQRIAAAIDRLRHLAIGDRAPAEPKRGARTATFGDVPIDEERCRVEPLGEGCHHAGFYKNAA
jgi:hypothetical protein